MGLFSGVGQFTDNVFLNWNLLPSAGSAFQRNLFVGDSCINGQALVKDNFFDTNSMFWTLWGSEYPPCLMDASRNYWGSINNDLVAIEEKILDSEDTYNRECDVSPVPVLSGPPSIPVYSPGTSATVATGTAADVTTSAATINATINHDWAQDLDYGVEYATTADFSQPTTSWVTPPNGWDFRGNTDEGFQTNLSGLAPGTTYYYRAIARTAPDSQHHWGPTVALQGQVRSFATVGGKPTVVNGAITTTTDAADLRGTFNANHLPTSIQVQVSKTEDFNSPSESAPQALDGNQDTDITIPVGNLQPGTSYQYRFKAVNEAGTTYGQTGSFTTLGNAPGVTTGDAVVSPRSAQVMAFVNPNQLATTVTVEFGVSSDLTSGTSLAGGRQLNGNQSENLTVLLTGLTPDTRYYYRAKATNKLGESLGQIKSFTTPAEACLADTNIGVSINDGNPYTNTRDVQLMVRTPGCATGIRVSNDGDFSNSTLVPPTSSISWQLDDRVQGKYTKLVYVRFTGPGVNESQTFTDDIIMDTQAPTVSLLKATSTGSGNAAAAALVSGPRRVTVTCKARDDKSGVRKLQISAFKTKKSAATTDYRKKQTLTLKGARQGKKFYARVLDGAGNWSKWKRGTLR